MRNKYGEDSDLLNKIVNWDGWFSVMVGVLLVVVVALVLDEYLQFYGG